MLCSDGDASFGAGLPVSILNNLLDFLRPSAYAFLSASLCASLFRVFIWAKVCSDRSALWEAANTPAGFELKGVLSSVGNGWLTGGRMGTLRLLAVEDVISRGIAGSSGFEVAGSIIAAGSEVIREEWRLSAASTEFEHKEVPSGAVGNEGLASRRVDALDASALGRSTFERAGCRCAFCLSAACVFCRF